MHIESLLLQPRSSVDTWNRCALITLRSYYAELWKHTYIYKDSSRCKWPVFQEKYSSILVSKDTTCIKTDGCRCEMKCWLANVRGQCIRPICSKGSEIWSYSRARARRISSTCSLFLRHGGAIACKITDSKKQYSKDLEQGGLEIPCVLLFQAESELLDKVQKLLSLSEKNFATSESRARNDQKAVAVKHKVK